MGWSGWVVRGEDWGERTGKGGFTGGGGVQIELF